MWRRFSAEVEDFAKTYAADLRCHGRFTIDGDRRGGGSIAFPVTLVNSKRRAFVKPAVAAGDNARTAAHEKIAADLGYALGLPVAPVILSNETHGHGLPTTVALSFVTFPQPRPWATTAPILTNVHKTLLRSALSGMWVFHTWIEDHDHNWNEGNALFEVSSDGNAGVVFYDYGHSLTHQWIPPAAAPTRNWGARNGPFQMVQPGDMLTAIERIEQFPVKQLESIIGRIPPDCMPVDLGRNLIVALDQRRAELRKLLNLEGAP
jgi:hypothetical protein